MGYFLYSAIFFALACSTGTCNLSLLLGNVPLLTIHPALYLTRHQWLHRLPIPEPLYTRLPTSFRDDIEAGLSSAAFDLSANVEAGDSRQGLDGAAKAEVQRIMKRRGVGFDEARRLYMQERFKREGIAPDGRPRDPKFVSFS